MRQRGLVLLLTCMLIGASPAISVQADVTAGTQTNQNEAQTRYALAPSGISKDAAGSLYIADRSYQVLRMRKKDGTYTVLAGTSGVSGYKDGGADKARFDQPWDVVSYRGGWLISDSENHALRLYQNGRVTTIAGNGKSGYKNANGKKARFNRPTGMAAGKNGEVYISDTGNNVIRKLDKKGKVTTFAGKKAGLCEPTGLFYYKGALYVADSGNHRICKIENGKVTTVAGSARGVEGKLSNPQDIYLAKNVMYISDTGNACVKKLEDGKLTTLVDAFSLGDGRAPAEPAGLIVKGQKLLIGDTFTEEMYRVKL